MKRHVSSPLSAVFAVGQARGTLHLGKKVATQAEGRKEGCFMERPRPEKERKEQQQNSFPPETHTYIEEKREGGAAGTISCRCNG